MRILIIALTLLLAGCTVTKSELMANDENRQTWRVDAPIEKVFKAYKAHAEEHYYGTTGLLGDGFRTDGYFYTSDAELTIRYVGNPMASIVYLQLNMIQEDSGTAVTSWHYNGPWKSHADRFRELVIE